MIFLTRAGANGISIENGIFISTQMSMKLADEINSGNLELSEPLIPVHPPWDGLLKVFLGKHDDMRVSEENWIETGLPYIYRGESLNEKKLIVFPMHGLGDQLYLAAAIRALVRQYPESRVIIVRPAIESSEQWFRYIYHDDFFTITGPVVTSGEMADYDYYINAEHFAHIPDYEGTYPPEFYMKYFFHHEPVSASGERPAISCSDSDFFNPGVTAFSLSERLRTPRKPVVFLSLMTTGRVRDILPQAAVELVKKGCRNYSFIVSTYNNDTLEQEIQNCRFPDVYTTKGVVQNVTDLIFLLSKSDYVLTSDSGITHLAEALEKPCGSVFNVVTPEERTAPYRFSEQMMVQFEISGVCKTPCYFHALEEMQECAGMKWMNENERTQGPRRFAPCMENLSGEHLGILLESLTLKFGCRKSEAPVSKVSGVDRIIERN